MNSKTGSSHTLCYWVSVYKCQVVTFVPSICWLGTCRDLRMCGPFCEGHKHIFGSCSPSLALHTQCWGRQEGVSSNRERDPVVLRTKPGSSPGARQSLSLLFVRKKSFLNNHKCPTPLKNCCGLYDSFSICFLTLISASALSVYALTKKLKN